MDDLEFLQNSFEDSQLNLRADKPLLPKLVLVEDDTVLAHSIKKYLQKTLHIEVIHFASSAECVQGLENWSPLEAFCFVTDISLGPGIDGLALIDLLKQKGLRFVSLAMTGFGSIENAISATKKGVYQYLTKPFELENFVSLIKEVLVKEMHVPEEHLGKPQWQAKKEQDLRLVSDLYYKIEAPKEDEIFCGMVGRSAAMRDIFERIRKVANCDSTVLITGPSGTGKELIANALHQLSSRKQAPLVSVNCGAIPADLLESELFGHVKGAFTGAISNRDGKFEKANGGSLFLDEIGDMPLLLQVKLLRVLQSKQVEPVGSNRPRLIDTRIITATHRDLDKLVMEGFFREDLFYRLNVIPIRIPALKERREDIPILVGHFLNRFVSADRSNRIDFSPETMELIIHYDWPGNIRELENLIERLVILRGGHTVRPEDLPPKIFRNNPLAKSVYNKIFELPEAGVDLRQILSDIEDSLIIQALERTNGNKNQASKILSLNRTTLIEKMKKKQISLQAFD